MAETPDNNNPLLKLKEQVTCCVCLEVYKQPKSLTCQHAFCIHCIDQLPLDIVDGEHKIKCPSCREVTTLPKDGSIDSLPPAFHINAMIELYETSKALPIVVEEVSECTKCPKHHRDMEMFCEECEQVVCAVCLVHEHSNHTCDLITAAFPKHKQQIEAHLGKLQQAIAGVIAARDTLEALEKGIDQQVESTKNEIDVHVQTVIERVQKYGKEIKENVDKLVYEKLELMAKQKAKSEIVLHQLTDCKEHVQKQLHNAAQEVVLKEKASIIASIEAAFQEIDIKTPCRKEYLVFVPDEDKYIGNIGKATNITLPKAVSSTKAVATFSGRGSVVAGIRRSQSMELHLPSKPKGMIFCCLYNENESKTIVCEVGKLNATGGKVLIRKDQSVAYSLSYIPTHPGLHHVILQDGDTIIPCDPCTIPVLDYASNRRRKYNRQRKLPDDIITPRGMAITKEDVIVVCEEQNHSIALVKEQFIVRRFGKQGTKKGQLCYPTGVAITPDGHIVVADSGNDCIRKFTVDGQCIDCIGAYGNKKLQFKSPYDVAVDSKGSIYVSDTGNQRIQVLKPNLTFSHMFSKECPFHGITIDSHNIVYVCDVQYVYMFTCEGKFIDKLSGGDIDVPRAIAVDQYDIVYVTDISCGTVTLFDCGECIATLYTTSPKPCGIAIDSKGSIVVSYF